MIRVFLVDDHRMFREGLKAILGQEPNIEIIGEAANAAEAISVMRNTQWDVALVDISLPDRSGVEVLGQIGDRGKVLMVSMHCESQYAIRCLRAGARGYLTKESAAEEVVIAVNKIMKGGNYVSQNMAEILVEAYSNAGAGELHTKLSNREFEVFRLIVAGRKRAQIAESLKISPKTFDGYRRSLIDKLDCQGDADLVRYALTRDLFPS